MSFFCCDLAFGEGLVFGQGTDLGTIRGIVTDTTGAIIHAAGRGTFAWLGLFVVRVDQATGKLLPIDPVNDVTRNDQFGHLISSFTQEGIDNRRSVRLRLRITF